MEGQPGFDDPGVLLRDRRIDDCPGEHFGEELFLDGVAVLFDEFAERLRGDARGPPVRKLACRMKRAEDLSLTLASAVRNWASW